MLEQPVYIHNNYHGSANIVTNERDKQSYFDISLRVQYIFAVYCKYTKYLPKMKKHPVQNISNRRITCKLFVKFFHYTTFVPIGSKIASL